MSEPKLLRIPEHFRSVDDMLGAAKQLGLTNALLISEREDGSLVFLDTDLTVAQANWMADRLKMLMLMPESFSRRDK